MTIYCKICSNCKISKPICDFSKDKQKNDGYCSHCKICQRNQYKTKKEQRKEYYQKNSNREKERSRRRRTDNPNYQKEWRENNKERINSQQRNRRAIDKLFALRSGIRVLIGSSFRNKGYSKKSKTHEILGCSYEEFYAHIEKQFTEGMSWENRSAWHLDHITPVSWAETEEEIIALNHFTNFQPLWAIDNIKKGNRFIIE